MFFKLPLAYISGMRVVALNSNKCEVRIKHRWINQNPFKSMFWAAQGMAAEMTTGVLVMQEIENSKRKVSMLVTHQEANFLKKATGKIVFSCICDEIIKNALQKSKETKEGQVIVLQAEGKNEEGVVVSNFKFHWSLKVKN